jgi:hypothetical protein
VRIGDDLSTRDQPGERLVSELVAGLDEVHDLATEDEEATVDPDIRLAHVGQADERAVSRRVYEMSVELGFHRQKQRDLPAVDRRVDDCVEASVGEAVSVGSKKDFFVADAWLHSLQPLGDRRVQPRVDERDSPVRRVR